MSTFNARKAPIAAAIAAFTAMSLFGTAAHADPLTAGAPFCAPGNTTVAALACAGSFSGNDAGGPFTQNTLDTLAANFGSYVPVGSTWSLVGKSDDAGSGPFTSNPEATFGTLSFDAPITGFFAISLKAANRFSLYLFDGGTTGISSIDFSTVGTSLNPRGKAQDLSHASLWGNSAAPIPEPETYALMLAGLGIVGFMARRKRSR